MRKIQARVEISDEAYSTYEERARRLGVSVEEVVGQLLQGLVERLEEEREEEDDHPIFFP